MMSELENVLMHTNGAMFMSVVQIQHQFGTILILVNYAYQEGHTHQRAWLRSTAMGNGVQSVMTALVKQRRTLFADNWATLKQRDTIILPQCETDSRASFAMCCVTVFVFSQGTVFQLIWLEDVICSSGQSCIQSCQQCPSSQFSRCRHSDDVTIQCSK